MLDQAYLRMSSVSRSSDTGRERVIDVKEGIQIVELAEAVPWTDEQKIKSHLSEFFLLLLVQHISPVHLNWDLKILHLILSL